MSIIGFTFTKVAVSKDAPVRGKVHIAHNIGVQNIVERPMSVGKDSTALDVQFTFHLTYDTDDDQVEKKQTAGTISLEGMLTILVPTPVATQTVSEWTEKKQVFDPLVSQVMNGIFTKSIMYAMQLSQDVNLPSPVPLPKLTVKAKDSVEDVTETKPKKSK